MGESLQCVRHRARLVKDQAKVLEASRLGKNLGADPPSVCNSRLIEDNDLSFDGGQGPRSSRNHSCCPVTVATLAAHELQHGISEIILPCERSEQGLPYTAPLANAHEGAFLGSWCEALCACIVLIAVSSTQ